MKTKLLLSIFVSSVFMAIPTLASATTPNLISNNSAETSTTNSAANWINGKWGTNTASFTTVSGDAQNGTKSLKVTVSRYSSGDAKWVHASVPVVAGTTYTFSNWYKSNVTASLVAEYESSTGTFQYAWLGDTAASATTWKQATANLTVPAGITKVRVFHLINRAGWLQTDNYSLNAPGSTPAPTPTPTPTPVPTPTPTPTPIPTPVPTGPFSKPLVSIEFDDGWTTAYQHGLPLVESYGWKPTQYIITQTPGWSGYMTTAQIIDWNKRADIGSHTVSHPSLPSLSKTRISSELRNSKTYLDNLLGEPTTLFVTPYCATNSNVVAVARTLYQSLRNCTPEVNTKANFDRYNLRSFVVLNTTTDAEITAMLNQAKASNGWAILVWHEVAGDNKNAWSVSPTTLNRQLQLIKNSGINVVPTQAALNASL